MWFERFLWPRKASSYTEFLRLLDKIGATSVRVGAYKQPARRWGAVSFSPTIGYIGDFAFGVHAIGSNLHGRVVHLPIRLDVKFSSERGMADWGARQLDALRCLLTADVLVGLLRVDRPQLTVTLEHNGGPLSSELHATMLANAASSGVQPYPFPENLGLM